MDGDPERGGAAGRRIGLFAASALSFLAMAVLFAQLLRPLVEPRPAEARNVHAARQAADEARKLAATVQAAVPAQSVTEPKLAAFNGPRIAIVLTEVGADPQQAYAAIAALPSAVGLAFTPYADAWAISAAARGHGHEVWAGVPMQPKAHPKVSPGPNTLLIANEPAENVRRLEWALGRVEAPAGVTNIMGSAFTENQAAMRPMLAALKSRGLAFLDARASAASDGEAAAREAGVPVGANDRFLDENGAIETNLAALEAVARKRGSAIGFARPLPATIEALAAWTDTLDDKGILLVPPGSLTR